MGKGSSFLANIHGIRSRFGGVVESTQTYLRVCLTRMSTRPLGHGQYSLSWSNSQWQMSERFSVCGWQNDRVLTCVAYHTDYAIPDLLARDIKRQKSKKNLHLPTHHPESHHMGTLKKIQISIVQNRKSLATQFEINHLRPTALNLNFPQ